MDREQLFEKFSQIKDVSKNRDIIYELLNELGLSYKKTNCRKCLGDYYAMIKEELGLIADASEESGWNGEWVYLCKHAQTWNGHIIDQNTDPKVIEEFVKRFPKGYFEKRSVK